MILYEKGTTDFTRNGLGYLNNVLNAYVEEEINGNYQLIFEYPIKDIMANEIIDGRIVKCRVSNGTQQCFIIKNIDKTYERMTITCSHLFYLLLDDFADDIYPQNLSPKPFLDWLLSKANYVLPFTTFSDVAIAKSGRYVRRNLVDIILGEQENSMVNLFGIEIERDNWNIGLMARIGANNGEKLVFGKNILGVDISIDTTSVYTRIMPVGFNGLLLPEKYLDAENINDYPYPKVCLFEFPNIKYDPDDENAFSDVNDAYEALRIAVQELYANKINYPKVNIKIDWLELSKTEEYKQYTALERVHLGDTVTCELFGMNYETRVIKTIYNPLTDRVDQFELGTFNPSFVNTMNAVDTKIDSINPQSILAEAQSRATNLITHAMGGYVYKTNSELFIMDTDNPATAEHVWRWNINGLGYSSTGVNGNYGIALTMDGTLNLQNLNVINLLADMIKGGTLKLGSNMNESGKLELYDESNRLISKYDKDGLIFYCDNNSYIKINSDVGFAGYNAQNEKTYWVDGDEFHQKKSVVEEEITLAYKIREIPITITNNGSVVNDGIGYVPLL